jgi:folate-dependent phosphoribosylglycinamide formyltransferase PurN
MASRTCFMLLNLHTRRCRWVTSAQRLAGPLSAGSSWGAALHGGAKRSRCIAAGWAITRAAASAAASEPDGAGGGRALGPFPGSKKLVFLGTPDVAAGVLGTLLDAAAAPGAGFHVAAVVSQPAKPRGRRKGGGSNNTSSQAALPSPVAQCALDRGLAPELVLTPPDAKDPGFLETMRSLQPDVCVTAAYGHYLPAAFLSIPPRGTVNIHPSLLPKYRGAAPVQRALQAGEAVSGVTVLYTVRAMARGLACHACTPTGMLVLTLRESPVKK